MSVSTPCNNHYCYDSLIEDMEYACNTRANNGGGGGFSDELFGDDAVVRLRGLPYDAGKMQIAEFFKGELKHSVLEMFNEN